MPHLFRSMLLTSAIFLSTQLSAETPQEKISFKEFLNQELINSELLPQIENGEEVILKVEQGLEIPVKLELTGPLFAFATGTPNPILRVKVPYYVKIMPASIASDDFMEFPEFLISMDGESWKTCDEFFTGSINVSIDEKALDPSVSISFDLQIQE